METDALRPLEKDDQIHSTLKNEAFRVDNCPCSQEARLIEWAKSQGVRTKLDITYFEEYGRAAVATTDLNVGDVALEIPSSLLISEQLVHGTNMYNILEKIEGISAETVTLLWTMKERHNLDSHFRLYFDALPKEFNTGLSFGYDGIMILDGTLLLDEIMQAKQHLREQYDLLIPTLCNNHPDVFCPDLYTWDHYLWACELWYSNSMKIMFPDGQLRTCLVPVAGFLNHSLNPHIVSYGKLDPITSTLKLSLSRPCHSGEQCFLSYGNFPSSHFVTFYGFIPKGENPCDGIPLDIDLDDNEETNSNNGTHLVRPSCHSSNHGLFHYGLPSSLLDCLRKARGNTAQNHTKTLTSLEIEMEILGDLHAAFSSMMEALGGPSISERKQSCWDSKLALEFKDLQRRLVSSVLDSCDRGIELLQDELSRFVGASVKP